MCKHYNDDYIDEIPGDVFTEALYNVVYTMTGFNVEKKISEEEVEKKPSRDIVGAMVLAGKKNMVLVVSVNKATASLLVSYMTGMDLTELKEEDLHDGITEFANMVAGSAKVMLTDTVFSYKLTSPFAVVGENIGIISKKSVMQYCQTFCANEVEIKIQIFSF